MPAAVIFDNDGVLVDSESLANRVLADLLTEAGVPTTYEDCIRDYLGGSVERVRRLVHERAGLALPDDFEDRYHELVFAAFRAGLRPVPGVVELLDALDRASVPYCVASSGTHERIRLALHLVGLLGRFDEARIFSSQDVRRGKPAPDLFLHAAAAMRVSPHRCAVVEDSSTGVEAARAAGMTVYGYAATTPAERLSAADAVATELKDLKKLLLLESEPLAPRHHHAQEDAYSRGR